MDDPRAQILREVRQRLESLQRAGLDGLPWLAACGADLETRDRPDASAAAPVEASPQPLAEPEPPIAPLAVHQAVAPPQPTSPPISLFDGQSFETEVMPEAERPAALAELAAQVAQCKLCPVLVKNRTRTVFGEGNPSARLMFVGEAPGADEDRTGRPFVGRAGQLLNDMITKGMGLKREEVYIANVLKSRPPENRQPLPDEVAHCLPFLERQIEIVRPQFLCLLGLAASMALLNPNQSLGRMRKRWHLYRGIRTIVTYHPAYLLRYSISKKDAWEDLQMLMEAMGLKVPERSRA
jgi:DNA polymerase